VAQALLQHFSEAIMETASQTVQTSAIDTSDYVPLVWLDGHVVGSYSEQHKAQAQARLLGGHVEAVWS
jgi:hypothetical protein